MAVTLSGTFSTSNPDERPRVEATNQGQSIEFGPTGGTDLNSTVNLQTASGGSYQFLNNVIAVWAASTAQDARSSMVQIWTMLNSMLNQPETTATKSYTP